MNKDCSLAEKVLTFEKTHKTRKQECGHRLHVARTLLRRYYKEKKQDLHFLNRSYVYDFLRDCEAVLDNMLSKYDYDVDLIIEKLKKVTPALKYDPIVCINCGYRPVFCSC